MVSGRPQVLKCLLLPLEGKVECVAQQLLTVNPSGTPTLHLPRLWKRSLQAEITPTEVTLSNGGGHKSPPEKPLS